MALVQALTSHPSQGAWIETMGLYASSEDKHRTPRRVHGLKRLRRLVAQLLHASHPSQGAWIQTQYALDVSCGKNRTPPGCVD